MLIIRLQRVGKRNEPTFRVVLTDSKNGPKSGKFLEVLGSYDPRDKNITKIDGDKVKEWMSKGAQVSDTVHNILINQGIIEGDKINVLPKKAPIIDEEALAKEKEEAEAKAAAEAEAEKTEEAPAEETPAEDVSNEEPAPAEEPVVEPAPETDTEKAEEAQGEKVDADPVEKVEEAVAEEEKKDEAPAEDEETKEEEK
jgi:small subunit ribosomal protein S16